MSRMKPRRKSARQETSERSGPNWMIIGPIVAIAVIALIGLGVVGTLNPSVAAEPTPVLSETVSNATGYCESNPERCVIIGNPDAEVTMIEIPDYGCPHCANFNATKAPTLLANYVETDQVRWIVMPFALGPGSQPSAEAVMCVNEQGSELALKFHENIFALQGTNSVHTKRGFLGIAANIDGIDEDALETCIDDGRRMQDVSFNQQAARSLGVRSTPSFFLSNRLISGNQDLEVFQQSIDAELN